MRKANDDETSTTSEKIEKYEYFFGPDQWDADGVDHVQRILETKNIYSKTKNGYLVDNGDGTYACIRPE